MLTIYQENENNTMPGEEIEDMLTTVNEATEEHPVKEIWDCLLRADTLLRELQSSHAIDDELFEWILIYTQEIQKFLRIVQRSGVVRKR